MAKKKRAELEILKKITETRTYHKGSVLRQKDGKWELACPICSVNYPTQPPMLEYQELSTVARPLGNVVTEDDGEGVLMIEGETLDSSDTGSLPGISCSTCGGFFEVPANVEWR